MAILNKTRNGSLSYCTSCKAYHIEFGNLMFNFTESELQLFTNYINGIDGDYFNRLNEHVSTRRRIILPTKLKGISFAMHLEELNEFKMLLNFEKTHHSAYNMYSLRQIHCDFSPN